jgi:WD40 repeat protein
MGRFSRSLAWVVWGVAILALTGGSTRAADEPEDADALPSRVVPVFDPGSHVRPILDMGFSADGKRLITAGGDYTVQVWNVATGERVDMFRLPPYGQEEGYNPKEWNVAAVSPNGKLVAVGGGQKLGLSPDNPADRAKLVLVDVEKRTLLRLAVGQNGVTALVFSADSGTLVVAMGGQEPAIFFIDNLGEAKPRTRRRRSRRILTVPGVKRQILTMAFSADESKLVASGPPGFLCGWDLSKEGDQPAFTEEVSTETSALAWSPDGTRFVRTRVAVGSAGQTVELRGADGKLIREWIGGDEATGNAFDKRHVLWDARWKGPDEVYIAANVAAGASGGEGQPGRAELMLFDVKQGKSRRVAEFDGGGRFSPSSAISPDGKVGAITVEQGLDAILFRVADGKEISRCGAKSPAPSLVGWSTKGPPRIAWSESFYAGRMNTDLKRLEVAFDLEKLELDSEFDPGDFQSCQRESGRSETAGGGRTSSSCRKGERSGGSTESATGCRRER